MTKEDLKKTRGKTMEKPKESQERAKKGLRKMQKRAFLGKGYTIGERGGIQREGREYIEGGLARFQGLTPGKRGLIPQV
jgi:hypothetical protein